MSSIYPTVTFVEERHSGAFLQPLTTNSNVNFGGTLWIRSSSVGKRGGTFIFFHVLTCDLAKKKKYFVHDILILVLKISYHLQIVMFCYYILHHRWAWKRNSYPFLILIWLLKNVFCKWKKSTNVRGSLHSVFSDKTNDWNGTRWRWVELKFEIMPLKTYLNSVYIK